MIFMLGLLIPCLLINLYWLIRDARWHFSGSPEKRRRARDGVLGNLIGFCSVSFVIAMVVWRN